MNSTSSYPKLITLGLTSRCNIKCNMCWHSYRQSDNSDFKYMDKVIPFLKQAKHVVFCSGGESVLHKDFLSILDSVIENECMPSLTTNGLHMPSGVIEKLGRFSSFVTVSLDGSNAEVYESIRHGSSFDKVCDNIRSMLSAGCRVVIQYTIQKNNLSDVEHVVELCALLGVKYLKLQTIIPFSDIPEIDHLLLTNADVSNLIAVTLPGMIKDGESKGVRVIWNSSEIRSLADESGLSDLDEEESDLPCLSPWREIVIQENGLVKACCMSREESIGDLNHQSLEEIWFGYDYEDLRSGIINREKKRHCKSCFKLDSIPFLGDNETYLNDSQKRGLELLKQIT